MFASPSLLPLLPPSTDLETVPVLKALALANRALAHFVQKLRAGRSNYYVNAPLVQMFLDVSGRR